MRTIHKYRLAVADVQKVVMPENAKVLSLQMQHGCPTLWAEVDTDAPMTQVAVRMYGTGFEVGATGRYLGTVQLPDGTVWHYYGATA